MREVSGDLQRMTFTPPSPVRLLALFCPSEWSGVTSFGGWSDFNSTCLVGCRKSLRPPQGPQDRHGTAKLQQEAVVKAILNPKAISSNNCPRSGQTPD